MKKGWKIVKLPDLAKSIFAGGDVDKNNLSEVKTEEYPYPIYTNGETNDGLYGYTSIFRVNEPAITVSARGTIGFTCLRKEPYYPAVRLINIIPKENVNINYLNYFIKSKTVTSSGASIPQLTVPMVKEFDIGIPESPEEQQTIVAKLDQAFAAIDQAKANIETNISNAKELFQSKLNQIFSQKGEGWEEKKLGEISKINYGYTEKAVFENIGPKYLRITDLTEKGVNWESVPHCKISKDEIIKYELQKGDIVFARTGATTGKSYLFDDDVFSVFASYLIRLKVINKNEILPEFIYLFFQSGNYWKEINAGISGSAQGGFNASKLSDLKLSYPLDSNIQKKIVTDFDVVLSQTNLLVTKYKQKLANLEELKKSILEKAFKGELSTAAIEKV